MADHSKVIEVSRRINASAAVIFNILANPRRHQEIDGSGMVPRPVEDRPSRVSATRSP